MKVKPLLKNERVFKRNDNKTKLLLMPLMGFRGGGEYMPIALCLYLYTSLSEPEHDKREAKKQVVLAGNLLFFSCRLF